LEKVVFNPGVPREHGEELMTRLAGLHNGYLAARTVVSLWCRGRRVRENRRAPPCKGLNEKFNANFRRRLPFSIDVNILKCILMQIIAICESTLIRKI
jgi:hypothetical protein